MNPRVLEITPIEGHKLKLLFDNGEQRFYDCSGLLDFGVFQELQDKSYFTDVTQPLPSQGRLLCHVCRLRPVAPSPAVIPAHAGIQPNALASKGHLWMPAFAGMTLGPRRLYTVRNIS